MSDTNTPQVEPLRLTFEEALVAIAKKRGTTLAYHVGDGSHDDPSGWVEAETGTLYGDYRHWRDAASRILGWPVVERDDTAYWRLSAHVENALAPVLGYEYDEAVGWNVGEHTAESLVLAAASRIAELIEAVEAYLAAEDHLDATMDDRYEVSDTRAAAEEVIRRKDELRQTLSRVKEQP